MRKGNVFFNLISPIMLEWILTFAVQGAMLVFMPELLENAVVYTMLVSLVIIPVMAWIYRRDCRQKPWQITHDTTWITYLAVSMLGITSCIGLNLLVSITQLYEYSEKYQNVSSVIYDAPRVLQVVAIVFVAPLVEELVYRGLVYRRMREIGPVLPAVLISSIVFGINHGNLVQFVFATGIGILLTLAYEQYRKISIPILMHMSVNLTSLLLTWMGDKLL